MCSFFCGHEKTYLLRLISCLQPYKHIAEASVPDALMVLVVSCGSVEAKRWWQREMPGGLFKRPSSHKMKRTGPAAAQRQDASLSICCTETKHQGATTGRDGHRETTGLIRGMIRGRQTDMKKGRRTDTDMWVRKVRNWEVEEWGGCWKEQRGYAWKEEGTRGMGGYGQGGVKRGGEVWSKVVGTCVTLGPWQELCHWSIWLAWSLGEVTRCNSGGMVTVCQWPFHQGPVMACQNMLRGSTLQCCRWLIVLCLTEPAVLVTYPLVSFKWKSVFEKKKGAKSKLPSYVLLHSSANEALVFSCCGLMRMSRVLQSCKQNPSEDKMPRYPRPSYQQIRFDKKQTRAQALAFWSCCILQHFIKHKVLWKCFSVCVSCELLTNSLLRLLAQCYWFIFLWPHFLL